MLASADPVRGHHSGFAERKKGNSMRINRVLGRSVAAVAAMLVLAGAAACSSTGTRTEVSREW
jgi:hypothetical protein